MAGSSAFVMHVYRISVGECTCTVRRSNLGRGVIWDGVRS